jgi:site-specific DNA-methyltransferase (adenine-specific)
MVVNIEDDGFEIRDVVSWIYGSGFPISLNVSKAIDRAAGAEREVVGVKYRVGDHTKAIDNYGWKESGGTSSAMNTKAKDIMETAPATEAAKQWDGWGTALKPACEFFTLCRKPLSEKTVAANVLKWGTGGINIDGCRVGSETIKTCGGDKFPSVYGKYKTAIESMHTGRFPANLIHDGSQEVLDLFPESGDKSPSRFFYCAKASKKDRNEGCEALEEKIHGKTGAQKRVTVGGSKNIELPKKNHHPTVKPTALMAHLCRLITPQGGVVLDPYMGSGSTGKAAVREGFSFIGCELDEDYFQIAKARVSHEV